MKIERCTFTGVDTEVGLTDLVEISKEFGFVEWGYLYSPVRAGTPGRYMSAYRIEEHLNSLPGDVKVALHICGKGVTDFMFSVSCYQEQLVEAIRSRGGRVQLNFNHSRQPLDLGLLAERMKAYSNISFIVQENNANKGVINSLVGSGVTNLSALFDSSGGRGVVGKWRAPLGIPCGYAGGLGPQNIRSELAAINSVVDDQTIWIDMESRIRQVGYQGVDFIDLMACKQVLRDVRASGYLKY